MKRTKAWRRLDALHIKLLPLKKRYAKAASQLLTKHFDVNQPTGRLAAMQAGAVDLEIVFALLLKSKR